jgi:diadenosine tetraphosphate (Ap4A) HIT family hydrolase
MGSGRRRGSSAGKVFSPVKQDAPEEIFESLRMRPPISVRMCPSSVIGIYTGSRIRMKQPPCRLCDALSGRLSEGGIRRCDTVLRTTQNFAVLPAIGPLVIGHAMIVSRQHFTSLAAMPLFAITEYDSLVRQLLKFPSVSGDLLEAEHGGTTGDSAGGCISHTHVNILPGLSNHSNIFDRQLPVLKSFTELTDIHELQYPYIMLRSNGGQGTAFLARGLPSQFIRLGLANALSLGRWDWRTSPEPEIIDQSIAFWEGASDA